MKNIFSSIFLSSIKRQVILKALDLLIDALIDLKQNYANKTNPNNKDVNIPTNSFNNHL